MERFFLAVSPGLEEIAQREAAGFGILCELTQGGLSFDGGLFELYKMNYLSRTGNRVLVRIGQPFYARSVHELGQRSMNLPWNLWLSNNSIIKVNATCTKSRLIHSGMVENVVISSIRKATKIGSTSIEQTSGPTVKIFVRVNHDLVTISIDSSGELLHKRGYRQQITKSPIKETLAAALIMTSGWKAETPLIDPFCGSGTIPIEAALIGLSIPPGYKRRFAFEDWPNFDQKTFNKIKNENLPKPRELFIYGFDRDMGAIEISKNNAKRADVEEFVTFKEQALSYMAPSYGIGHIITNPPYGARISSGRDLRNLYAQFGKTLREKFRDWSLTIITNDLIVAGHADLNFNQLIKTSNGGIETVFISAKIK